jgi:hypothetical protein
LHRALIEFIAHADVEFAGDYGHVFRRGMPMWHYSITIRELKTNDEWAGLAGITGEHCELSSRREDGGSGAPLNLVWCYNDRSGAGWFGFSSGFLWRGCLRQSQDWEQKQDRQKFTHVSSKRQI